MDYSQLYPLFKLPKMVKISGEIRREWDERVFKKFPGSAKATQWWLKRALIKWTNDSLSDFSINIFLCLDRTQPLKQLLPKW